MLYNYFNNQYGNKISTDARRSNSLVAGREYNLNYEQKNNLRKILYIWIESDFAEILGFGMYLSIDSPNKAEMFEALSTKVVQAGIKEEFEIIFDISGTQKRYIFTKTNDNTLLCKETDAALVNIRASGGGTAGNPNEDCSDYGGRGGNSKLPDGLRYS